MQGTIQSYNPYHKRFKVEYDDAQSEKLNLLDEDFK